MKEEQKKQEMEKNQLQQETEKKQQEMEKKQQQLKQQHAMTANSDPMSDPQLMEQLLLRNAAGGGSGEIQSSTDRHWTGFALLWKGHKGHVPLIWRFSDLCPFVSPGLVADGLDGCAKWCDTKKGHIPAGGVLRSLRVLPYLYFRFGGGLRWWSMCTSGEAGDQ
eukprot:g72677.t1